MSEQNWERHTLPPLQLLIIQYLANSEAQDIHEIATGLSKQYKSTYRAFEDLKREGLINKTVVKTYRGREYAQYWLTPMGVYEALINGFSSEKLLETTRRLIPENSMLHCCLEIAPYISPDVFRIGLYAILEHRMVKEVEAIAMMLANEQKNPTTETYLKIAEIMIKYPKVRELMKKRLEEMNDNLNQLKDII